MDKTKKLVAITQPDFFPWLGSIYKLVNVDEFVFLDHVANRVTDGIWTKRVKIIQNKEPKWLTIPLKKIKDTEFVPINEMQIADDKNFVDKHLKTIEINYKKAQYYNEIMPLVEKWYESSSQLVAERNISFLQTLRAAWNISSKVNFSSELKCHLSSNELLIEIIKKVEGTAYLYGSGSAGYLKPELFNQAGIELIAQNYTHPIYKQFNSDKFITGLSCLDALMNCGIIGTKELVYSK